MNAGKAMYCACCFVDLVGDNQSHPHPVLPLEGGRSCVWWTCVDTYAFRGRTEVGVGGNHYTTLFFRRSSAFIGGKSLFPGLSGFNKFLIRQLQRRFVHRRALFAQRQYLILPVALRIEPRKILCKCRVIPTPRQPARVMDHAQRTQGFDQ